MVKKNHQKTLSELLNIVVFKDIKTPVIPVIPSRKIFNEDFSIFKFEYYCNIFCEDWSVESRDIFFEYFFEHFDIIDETHTDLFW